MTDAVVAGDGVDLAVREFGGSGPPALLLHGAGLTLVDMAPLASHLTADHRVVGMDLRNHGRSGDGPWQWDAVLADIHAVIQRMATAHPIIVGHSMGGMLAAMYAERYGDIAAAVNLDGHALGTSEHLDMEAAEAARLRQRLREMSDQTIHALGQPRTSAEVAAAREAWVAGALALGLDAALAREAFDRKLVDAGDGSFLSRPATESLTHIRDALESLDLLGLYGRSSVPQLVYVAAADRPDPNLPEDVRALAVAHQRGLVRQLRLISQTRPSVQLIELSATHGLIYECPELIADQIRDYRTSLAQSPATVGPAYRERS